MEAGEEGMVVVELAAGSLIDGDGVEVPEPAIKLHNLTQTNCSPTPAHTRIYKLHCDRIKNRT